MAKRITARQLATRMTDAHSNLNVYGVIVQILEGGSLYGGRHERAQRIIESCKQGMQEELRIHDIARAKLDALELRLSRKP